MKRFALLVGVLAITAGAHAADDTTEFKNDGEFRVRYLNIIQKTSSDPSGQNAGTAGRLKWNLTARKGEKAQAFLSVIHNATFGGQGSTGQALNGTAGGNGSVGQDLSSAQNGLVVNRAWGWWKASDSVSLNVGRLPIVIGDGSFFSEDDYFAYPIAHEGLDAAWDTSFAALHLYAVKSNDNLGTTTGNSDPERNFYIVSGDLKNMPESIKMANLHIMQVNRDAFGTKSGTNGAQNWEHIGLTVAGDASVINYKVTAAVQTGSFNKPDAGTEQKINANMFDILAGYKTADLMGLNLSLNFHQDSGTATGTTDNQTYQPLFYDRHNHEGLMDIMNWGNLTYFAFKASMMPSEDLETGLGAFVFSKTQSSGTFNAGAGPFTVANSGSATDLGTELDLYANKSYVDNIKINSRVGYFIPGGALKNATVPASDKGYLDFMLQASLGF